jgi:hypothetical protein
MSDYTWMNTLNMTLAGNAFPHKLYHYRLVYSGWTYVRATPLAPPMSICSGEQII